jgi:hypothetical protein
VAYATYFDGFLSKDIGATRTHNHAMAILGTVLASPAKAIGETWLADAKAAALRRSGS